MHSAEISCFTYAFLDMEISWRPDHIVSQLSKMFSGVPALGKTLCPTNLCIANAMKDKVHFFFLRALISYNTWTKFFTTQHYNSEVASFHA